MNQISCSFSPNGEMSILLPIHTVSEANVSGKLRQKIGRKTGQRHDTTLILQAYWRKPPPFQRAVIVLTRYGLGNIDAHDNLPRALKHVVDGVADWLGIDDGSPRLGWHYLKEFGPPSVRVQFIPNARLETRIVRI